MPGFPSGMLVRTAILATLAALLAAPAAAAERWLSLEEPRFTVISQLTEKATRAWASQFSQYIGALKDHIHVEESKLPRLTIVLFARERDFEPYKPARPDGTRSSIVGFFSRRDEWAVAGMAGGSENADTRRVIFHEGAHWYMSAIDYIRPPWLEEGIAEVYSTFESDGRRLKWGEAIDNHVRFLRTERGLAMERLLGVVPGDPLFNEDERAGAFYARSWTFVHYLLFGQREGNRNALAQFLAATRDTPPTQAIFREVFGTDYAGMDRRLDDYLRAGSYLMVERPVAASAADSARMVEATPFAVEVALSRLALGSAASARAEQHARAAIRIDPSSPLGHELLGLTLDARGDPASAGDAFAAAAERDSRSHRVYYELGTRLLYGSPARGQVATIVASAEAKRKAADHFHRAIELSPSFDEGYKVLALALHGIERPTVDDRAALLFGHRRFPHNDDVTLSLALIARKDGRRADAAALLAEAMSPQRVHSATSLSNARNVEAAWRYEDLRADVLGLVDAGKLQEALQRVAAGLKDANSPAQQKLLENLHRELSINSLIRNAQLAVREARWREARFHLGELIAMNPDPPTILSARQMLRQLDQQKLGLD